MLCKFFKFAKYVVGCYLPSSQSSEICTKNHDTEERYGIVDNRIAVKKKSEMEPHLVWIFKYDRHSFIISSVTLDCRVWHRKVKIFNTTSCTRVLNFCSDWLTVGAFTSAAISHGCLCSVLVLIPPPISSTYVLPFPVCCVLASRNCKSTSIACSHSFRYCISFLSSSVVRTPKGFTFLPGLFEVTVIVLPAITCVVRYIQQIYNFAWFCSYFVFCLCTKNLRIQKCIVKSGFYYLRYRVLLRYRRSKTPGWVNLNDSNFTYGFIEYRRIRQTY